MHQVAISSQFASAYSISAVQREPNCSRLLEVSGSRHQAVTALAKLLAIGEKAVWLAM